MPDPMNEEGIEGIFAGSDSLFYTKYTTAAEFISEDHLT